MNEKKPDYLVLINGENRLPDGYEDTIELATIVNAAGDQHQIEKKTYEAYMRLREDLLKNDGIQIELTSVYRTVKFQKEIFDKYLKNFGLEYAKKYVATPGYSEHHTGLAIDVSIMVDGEFRFSIAKRLTMDHLYKPVQEKLAQYGFILRYPKGKEAITKIDYEPWHYRYVDSPEIAKEITEQGICFEEYCQKA